MSQQLFGNVQTEPNEFESSEYKSGDGMQTAIFGPVLWTYIHLVSFNYPNKPNDAQKQDHEAWLHSIGKSIPCKYCRDNFEANMREAKFCADVFENRETFSRFCYDLHAVVNKMLHKQTPYTFEQIRNKYEGFRARCVADPEATGELGCTIPMYKGTKAKSRIEIIPRSLETDGLCVSDECIIRRS